MAGDWIKMRSNLWDDPRVLHLCEVTDSAEREIIGALYWLWSTGDQHSADGIMPGLHLRTIDRKTGVDGLGAALVAIGWLADHPEGVRLVRFSEHNGASAKVRVQTAKRVNNFKANAKLTQLALTGFDDGVTTALPRVEKEKEKEKEEPPLLAGLTPARLPAPKKPDCPHQDIVALYHEVLPQCPKVRDWTESRQKLLRARWNEELKRQNLGYWREFFEYVGSCDFLVGRGGGNRPFFVDLPWMLKPDNFAKIREKNYES